MIIERTKHLVPKTEAAIEKVKAILDSIDDSYVTCSKHNKAVKLHYKNWQDFAEKAVSFGMLLPLDREWPTAPIQYYKTGLMPKIKVVDDVRDKPKLREKVKPKLGDGSVLKPNFNHQISVTPEKPEIYRPERVRASKLPVIARLEDMGAFDVEAKPERLRSMQR